VRLFCYSYHGWEHSARFRHGSALARHVRVRSWRRAHHRQRAAQGKAITDVGAGAGSQSRATDTHLVLRPHEEEKQPEWDAERFTSTFVQADPKLVGALLVEANRQGVNDFQCRTLLGRRRPSAWCIAGTRTPGLCHASAATRARGGRCSRSTKRKTV